MDNNTRIGEKKKEARKQTNSSKTTGRKRNNGTPFRAKDFWDLLKKQDGKCALTGRTLTPDTTEVELREPFLEDGPRTALDNHYLVTRALAYTARYVSERDMIELAIAIAKHRGRELGYEVRKRKS